MTFSLKMLKNIKNPPCHNRRGGLRLRGTNLVLLLPDDEGRGAVPTCDPAGELQSGVSLHHQASLAAIYLCY